MLWILQFLFYNRTLKLLRADGGFANEMNKRKESANAQYTKYIAFTNSWDFQRMLCVCDTQKRPSMLDVGPGQG